MVPDEIERYAGMFLSTEAVVADKPEPPAAGGDDAGAGMGGMY